MLLAIMGHILIDQYGEQALDQLAKWRHEDIKKEWNTIAKTTGRKDPEYLFRLFNNEVHEFEVLRKNRETLEVLYKSKSIADILAMSVEEALILFQNIPKIKQKLETLSQVGPGSPGDHQS